MALSDLPQVLEIENASFPQPFSEALFQKELSLDIANLFVIENQDDRKIVAYIDYWHVQDECHVMTLAVASRHKNLGLGSLLMEHMITDARQKGVRLISLEVRPSNDAALGLYRKWGFTEVGLRKHYYQDNQEDAILLNLFL